MSHDTIAAGAAAAPILALAGLAFGWLYFAALRRTAARLAAGGGWIGAAALTVGRIAAVVALLVLAARLGALALLATFAGFLLARALAVHAVRRAA